MTRENKENWCISRGTSEYIPNTIQGWGCHSGDVFIGPHIQRLYTTPTIHYIHNVFPYEHLEVLTGRFGCAAK